VWNQGFLSGVISLEVPEDNLFNIFLLASGIADNHCILWLVEASFQSLCPHIAFCITCVCVDSVFCCLFFSYKSMRHIGIGYILSPSSNTKPSNTKQNNQRLRVKQAWRDLKKGKNEKEGYFGNKINATTGEAVTWISLDK
jgi:hypothetical protein